MKTADYLQTIDMTIGTAKPEVVRKIMDSGESVGPELAYELTGQPDQRLSIHAALKAAGCKDAE